MSLGEYIWAWSAITQALWRFNGNANDSSGNAKDATTVTNITYPDGRFGAWANNNTTGTTNGVRIADNLWRTGNSDSTAALWAKITKDWSVRSLMYMQNSTTDNDFVMYYNNAAFIAGKNRYAVTEMPSVSPSLIPDSVRNHLVIVYRHSDTTALFYINWNFTASSVVSGNGSGAPNNVTVVHNDFDMSGTPTTSGSMVDEFLYEAAAWTPWYVRRQYTYWKWRFGIL